MQQRTILLTRTYWSIVVFGCRGGQIYNLWCLHGEQVGLWALLGLLYRWEIAKAMGIRKRIIKF